MPPNAPRPAVIFDLGGVLVRTEDHGPRRRWEERLGLSPGELHDRVFGSEASRRATLGHAHTNDVWDQLAREFALVAEDLDALARDFWAGDRLDQDLVAFITALRPQATTAILSNAWPDAREVFTERFGLAPAFDAMVISAEEGLAKPDPRLYELTLERLKTPARAAIFVDDVLANVEAARDVGVAGVHFRSPLQAMQEVQEWLDKAASDLAAVG